MRNDGGPVGIWLLSGNQGACAQVLCLPYGISRPALLFLPFFSPCASSSTDREWRWGYPFLIKKILAINWWMVLKWALWFLLLRNDREFSYLVRKEVWFPAPWEMPLFFSSIFPFLSVCLFSDKSYFVPDLFSSVVQRLSHCQVISSSLPVKSFHSPFPESSIKFVSPYVSSEKH